MKYIKKFETHSDYEDYLESQNYLTPNVSYCVDQNEVHFEKYVPAPETRIVATFNVTDTNNPTNIVGYITGKQEVDAVVYFESIELDGNEINLGSVRNGAYLMSGGEHTIKYTLLDETTLDTHAFYNCSSLTSITIPSSVTSFNFAAFRGCTGLTSIDIPSGVTSIGNQAFMGCAGLTSITIPSGVTSIGGSAFDNCSSLTSIDIPSGVTSIGNNTFTGCTGLTSITIPSSVTSIGQNTFKNCSSLTSITIPSSVTSIGSEAFSGCSGLTSITCEAATPPTLAVNALQSTNDCPIYVPAASVSAYQSASGWSTYASRIQAIPTA